MTSDGQMTMSSVVNHFCGGVPTKEGRGPVVLVGTASAVEIFSKPTTITIGTDWNDSTVVSC